MVFLPYLQYTTKQSNEKWKGINLAEFTLIKNRLSNKYYARVYVSQSVQNRICSARQITLNAMTTLEHAVGKIIWKKEKNIIFKHAQYIDMDTTSKMHTHNQY